MNMKSGVRQLLDNADNSLAILADRRDELMTARAFHEGKIRGHERAIAELDAQIALLDSTVRDHQGLRERTEAVKRIGEAVERGM